MLGPLTPFGTKNAQSGDGNAVSRNTSMAMLTFKVRYIFLEGCIPNFTLQTSVMLISGSKAGSM